MYKYIYCNKQARTYITYYSYNNNLIDFVGQKSLLLNLETYRFIKVTLLR